VEVEAHVAIRLRRLFPRVSERPGPIWIEDNDEICCDLDWFFGRYPVTISDEDEQYMLMRASCFRRRTESFSMVLSGEVAPRSFELALPPRHYQQVAADLWLRSGGLLVVDELGLGKTVVALAGLTAPETRPALVVVPTHLQQQWSNECRKFAPDLKTHILRTGKPYDIVRTENSNNGRSKVVPLEKSMLEGRPKQQQLFADDDRFPDVIITTYHKLKGWAEVLAPVLNGMVYDEVHELRREESLKYEAAKFLSEKVSYSLGLSGSPIVNYGGELWSIMNVLKPDCLGSRYEFQREWCHQSFGNNYKVKIRDPRAFGHYMREAGLMVRRTRKDVGRELPEVIIVPHHVDCNEKALSGLDDSVAELARIILEQGGAPLAKGRAARDLDWRLRQATGIAKAPYVAAFVKMLLESDETVVLFGWHREVYEIWKNALKDYKPAFFTGTETPAKKEESKEAFLSGRTKLLIMSLRAGSGIDGLQDVSRTVVYGELDWSPAVHEQGIGRLHRDGQSDTVTAYYLLAAEGSDPVIADVLGLKRQQSEGFRDPDGPIVRQLATDMDRVKKLAENFLEQFAGRDGGEKKRALPALTEN
jgi:SNF2 family DNA or RNA helicase